MAPTRHDLRLQALRLECRVCFDPEARATGHAEQHPSGRWRLEARCSTCRNTTLSYPPDDDPLVRRVLIDNLPPGPPVRARWTAPPLYRIDETASYHARSSHCEFRLSVTASGQFVHEDIPTTSELLRRSADAPDLLDLLEQLFASADLDNLPNTLGRGEHHAVIHPLGGRPVTLRWTQYDRVRHFDGAPGITPAVLDLVDGLITLLDWLDGEMFGPNRRNMARWSGDGEPRLFPRKADLLRGTPALYLAASPGSTHLPRGHEDLELWLSATGELEQRTIYANLKEPLSDLHKLSEPETTRIFSNFVALQPASFRQRVGFVAEDCHREKSHHRSLAWFDGRAAHVTSLVDGQKFLHDIEYGDTPPTRAELAAFALLAALERE